MTTTSITALICALYLVVLGITMLVRRGDLLAIVDEYRRSPALLFTGGMFALLFGLWIVLTHNIWTLSPSLIVTLLGWLSVVKGVVLMMWPSLWMKLFPSREQGMAKMAGVEGALVEILGLTLLWSSLAAAR